MKRIEERYISLLTDFGFKRIFGTKPNKDLLINFLNSLFDGFQVIKDVKYLNSEHVGDVFATSVNALAVDRDTASLDGAIIAEVSATLSLRMAATGVRAYYAAVAGGYLLAFAFLTLALNEGLGLGVAYGIWAASGVALTAVASKALFKEPLTALMMGGIALIIAGVLLVELGALH